MLPVSSSQIARCLPLRYPWSPCFVSPLKLSSLLRNARKELQTLNRFLQTTMYVCQSASFSSSLVLVQFESVERGDPIVATSEIGVYNHLNFKSISFVDTDPDSDGNYHKNNCLSCSLSCRFEPRFQSVLRQTSASSS